MLYIVFGPGKFRQEFKILLHSFCSCFVICYRKILKVFCSSSYRSGLVTNDSEIVYNINSKKMQKMTSLDFSDTKYNYGSTNHNIEEEDESV